MVVLRGGGGSYERYNPVEYLQASGDRSVVGLEEHEAERQRRAGRCHVHIHLARHTVSMDVTSMSCPVSMCRALAGVSFPVSTDVTSEPGPVSVAPGGVTSTFTCPDTLSART